VAMKKIIAVLALCLLGCQVWASGTYGGGGGGSNFYTYLTLTNAFANTNGNVTLTLGMLGGTNAVFVDVPSTAPVLASAVAGATNNLVAINRPLQVAQRTDWNDSTIPNAGAGGFGYTTAGYTNMSVADDEWAPAGYGVTNLQFQVANAAITITGLLANANGALTEIWSLEYPSNNFTLVTWGGATQVVLAANSLAVSNSDPIHVGIPAGAYYRVRGFITTPNGVGFPVGYTPNNPMGNHPGGGGWMLVGNASAISNETQCCVETPNAVNGGGLFVGLSPVAIIGWPIKPTINPVAVAIVGDSVAAAEGNSFTNNSYGRSYITEALANMGIPFIQTAVSGSDITNITQQGTGVSVPFFNTLGSNVTVFISEAGVNDVYQQGNNNLGAITNAYIALWSILTNTGAKVYQMTLSPVPAGTTNLLVQVNQWIRTCPAPLSGFIDVGNSVDTTFDSGAWYTGMNQDTVHPSYAGASNMMNCVLQSWPYLVNGARLPFGGPDLNLRGNMTANGLSVSGNSTLTGNASIGGNGSISGNLLVNNLATFNGGLSVPTAGYGVNAPNGPSAFSNVTQSAGASWNGQSPVTLSSNYVGAGFGIGTLNVTYTNYANTFPQYFAGVWQGPLISLGAHPWLVVFYNNTNEWGILNKSALQPNALAFVNAISTNGGVTWYTNSGYQSSVTIGSSIGGNIAVSGSGTLSGFVPGPVNMAQGATGPGGLPFLTSAPTNTYVNSELAIANALGWPWLAETGPLFEAANGGLALGVGTLYARAIYLPTNSAVNGVTWLQTAVAGATGPGSNGVALYRYDGSGNLNLITSVTNSACWSTAPANGLGSLTFLASTNLTAGLYFVALINNTGTPSIGVSPATKAGAITNYPNSAATYAVFTATPYFPVTISFGSAAPVSDAVAPPWVALW